MSSIPPQTLSATHRPWDFGFRISDFGFLSAFGLRISDFTSAPLLAALLVLLFGPSASAASLTNSAALPPVAPDLGASLIRVFGALGMVIALFLGGVWLFRNWQRLTQRQGRTPQLQVFEARSLGQRHALYVVGYREQRMLIAASPGGVSLLSHLPAGDPPPVPAAAAPVTEDFTAALQQALQTRS